MHFEGTAASVRALAFRDMLEAGRLQWPNGVLFARVNLLPHYCCDRTAQLFNSFHSLPSTYSLHCLLLVALGQMLFQFGVL